MKFSSLIGLASLSIFSPGAAYADATAPVDLAQRNGTFAPTGSIETGKKSPSRDDAVQEKRFETNVLGKKSAAIGDQRAALDVQEAREKIVREKDSHRPEAAAQKKSVLNHREAPVTTASDAAKPRMVTKYQDGLKAASALNMARFPAFDRGTTAKINRFVFRKNSPDAPAQTAAAITGGAPVVRAASGVPDEAPAKSGSTVLK